MEGLLKVNVGFVGDLLGALGIGTEAQLPQSIPVFIRTVDGELQRIGEASYSEETSALIFQAETL